jgi:hypothetical protein
MKLAIVIVALAISSSWAPAAAQKCVGLLQIPPSTSPRIVEFLTSFNQTNPPCGSGKVVLNRVLSREKTGGRRLEPDKPLDMTKAQANLDAALKDPAIKTLFDKARVEIKDESVLLAYEAAVLDDEGYYDARELKIQQLMQRLN